MGKLVAVRPPGSGNDTESRPWAEARARLALYLTALELPDAEAARLLEQALSRAQAAEPAVPLPAAMAALHELLARRPEPQPAAMPPLRRRRMVPAPIDRSLPRFLSDELIAPLARTCRSVLLRPHRLLGLAAALATAIGYRQIG